MFDLFLPEETERLLALQAKDAFARAILDQTSRILKSARFERVQPRAKGFLTWVVGKRLLGDIDQIKESTIAVSVFGEPADFDSSETSKIRVAAADLRERLKQFAELEGAHDPLSITLPTGSYVPLIVEGAPSIDIVELGNWSAGARDQHVRDAFIRELSLRLAEAGVRATEGPTQDFGCQRRQRYLLVGSFLCVNDVLYINVSLADPQSNRTVFADSYKDDRDSILKLGRTVSDGILSALNPAALFA